MTESTWQDWLPKLAAFHAEVLKISGGGGGNYLFKLHAGTRYGLTTDLSLLGVSTERAVTADGITLDLEGADESAEFEDEPTPDEEEATPGDPGSTAGDDRDEPLREELAAKRENAAAAARRIFLKQRGDPYNRETIIGFPLIAARIGRKKFSGPLFYWEVDLSLDAAESRLRLRRHSPSPALNSVLLSKFSEDQAEIDVVREQLIPVVQSDPFDLSSVDKAIRQVKGIFTPLKDLQEVDFGTPALTEFLKHLKDLSSREPPIVAPIPVLVNSSRSFAFIRDDLSKLSKLDKAAAGSLVSTFAGGLPDEVEPEEAKGLPFYDTADGGDPLWFPEQSNDAQRRVGRKARRVRSLTVQGPPGTGKSQTITNLVCDLVANGKSVLVTSHTRKALEVLDKKLPRIPHLAVPVLAGDRESLAKLRSELEAVQESGDEDPGELQEAVERAEQALRNLDSDLRHLDRRYSELRQIEDEEFSEHQKLSEIREFDRIHPEDSPSQNETSEIAAGLREYADALAELLPALDRFRSFYRPHGQKTTRAREALRQQSLLALLDLYQGLDEPLPQSALDFADKFVAEQGPSRSAEDKLSSWAQWLRTQGAEFREELEWLERRVDSRGSVVEALLASGRELGEVDALLGEWLEIRKFFQSTNLTGEELPREHSASERRELRVALERLRTCKDSFLAWYLTPSAHRARRTLKSLGLSSPGRREAERFCDRVSSILEWEQLRFDCRELVSTYDPKLPDGVVEAVPADASTRTLERHAHERVRVLEAIRDAESSPLRDGSRPEVQELGDTLLRQLADATPDELAHTCEAAAWRLEEVRTALDLDERLDVESEWEDHKAQVVRAVKRRDPDAADSELVEQLEALADHYSVFKRAIDLAMTTLSDMPLTLARLEEEMGRSGEIRSWVQNAETALEAHRLSSLLRQSLAANPDDLTDIAEQLSEGQKRRREIILKVIERRRQLGVRKAVRSPRTNNALLNMRDLLGRKRLTKSFLSLRNQIDYRELLRVFPCWICSIDDVARLFPLEAGLFDYIIIDEASQCPQTALLPLAFRARRAVIVGDRKQLQPASARFLSQDAVTLVAERVGITEHPVAEAYDGQKSLLDVADRYREEFDFLDEHFRCDPDIIRWSNELFYDNRLKILTHRRNRVFQPALEVRELKDADDDRETRTNQLEAERVVREVRRLIDSGAAERMTIGIISPYRNQADLLNELIEREFAGEPELKRRMRLLASTADGFQGDERDIILYSFRYGPSSHPATIHSIEREAERLNVAFTRAKRKVICFASQSLSRFPNGLIRSFLEHAKEAQQRPPTRGRRPDSFDSEFERQVCFRLRDRGLRVSTQELVARYRIDLAVEDDQGRILGVECDGDFKFNELGELRPHDYQRQEIIERAGWRIHRISGRSWLENPEREIDRVVEVLQTLPSAKEREVATGPRVSSEEVEEVAQETLSVGEPQAKTPVEDAEPDESAPEVETVLSEFGSTSQERVEAVKRLWRWSLLQGNLEGSALDALAEIEDKLELDKNLDAAELEFLEDLLYSAFRRGYNPDTVDDLPEQPSLLKRTSVGRRDRTEETRDDAEAPDEPWVESELSEIEYSILSYLSDAHPDGRDKYQISGFLVSEEEFARSDANPSRVNHFLYGPLSAWVEKRGDRPPKWYLSAGT